MHLSIHVSSVAPSLRSSIHDHFLMRGFGARVDLGGSTGAAQLAVRRTRERTAELQWLSNEAEPHAGERVALDRSRLVAHGVKLADVSAVVSLVRWKNTTQTELGLRARFPWVERLQSKVDEILDVAGHNG